MSESLGQMLILVQNGTPIRYAAKRVFGHVSKYYREVTVQQKGEILRARQEYEMTAEAKSPDRMVTSQVPLAASKRDQFKKLCALRNESATAVSNRLITLFIKHPDIFEKVPKLR